MTWPILNLAVPEFLVVKALGRVRKEDARETTELAGRASFVRVHVAHTSICCLVAHKSVDALRIAIAGPADFFKTGGLEGLKTREGKVSVVQNSTLR